MGAKIHEMGKGPTGGINYVFHCPGCQYGHPFEVPRWTWNGSFDRPTFAPSLLCNHHDPGSRCHSFVRDGKIQFLADCWHKLAGQTVEIPDWEESPEVVPERDPAINAADRGYAVDGKPAADKRPELEVECPKCNHKFWHGLGTDIGG